MTAPAPRRPATALFLLLLCAGSLAAAQTPFALTNIGADVRASDARIEGRGGWGAAESDTLTPSFHNIAGLPGLRSVAVVVCGYASRVASTTPDATRTSYRVLTPTLRVALPFATGRGVLTAGFRALRGTQYTTQTPDTTMLPDPADPLGPLVPFAGTDTWVREGTQFEVPLGGAYRVNDWLSVGASVNLVRGTVRERMLANLGSAPGSTSTPYISNSKVLEDVINGTSTTWSLRLTPRPGLAFGAVVTPSYGWDVTRTRTMQGLPGSRVTDLHDELPTTWLVGGQSVLRGRWRAGAEYESQPFGSFTGNTAWEAAMVDAWRVGFGLERVEADRRHGGWSNLPLRLGVAFARWPYTVNGAKIDETRVSIGTGLTFRERNGHLDLALSYGWYGDEAKQGIADRMWRLTVSLAGLERWW